MKCQDSTGTFGKVFRTLSNKKRIIKIGLLYKKLCVVMYYIKNIRVDLRTFNVFFFVLVKMTKILFFDWLGVWLSRTTMNHYFLTANEEQTHLMCTVPTVQCTWGA